MWINDFSKEELSCIAEVQKAPEWQQEWVSKKACQMIADKSRIAILALTLGLTNPVMANDTENTKWKEVSVLNQKAEVENQFSKLEQHLREQFPTEKWWENTVNTINEMNTNLKELFWKSYEIWINQISTEWVKIKWKPKNKIDFVVRLRTFFMNLNQNTWDSYSSLEDIKKIPWFWWSELFLYLEQTAKLSDEIIDKRNKEIEIERQKTAEERQKTAERSKQLDEERRKIAEERRKIAEINRVRDSLLLKLGKIKK